MIIDVTRHGCTVYPETYNDRRALFGYISRELLETETIYNKRTNSKEVKQKAVYAASTSDRREFRLLRADLEPFIEYATFDGVHKDTITIRNIEVKTHEKASTSMRPQFTPRNDEQRAAVDFSLKVENNIRTLEAATGFGKTFCGFYVACELKRRTAFIMEAGHIKTWVDEVQDYTDIAKDNLVVIKGAEGINTAASMAKMNIFTYDFVFISSTTMRNFITAYENKDEPFLYECTPQEFMELLGIGFVIRDEAHESIHALCKQTMYTNVHNILYLSATLVSDNAFVNTIYEKLYPTKERWQSKPNQHISVRSLFYGSRFSANLKTNGPRGYSHVAYEKSILKTAKLRKDYWVIVDEAIRHLFISEYKPGKKALIICATIKMCEFLAKQAMQVYPEKTIGVYVSGAKSEELYDRDIVFSTPKGAGTGVDIKNLSLGLNTVAISSTQLARQIMGRTRPIKAYPNDTPYFALLWNQNVKQHVQYERKRAIDSRGRCKDYHTVKMPFILG